MRAATDDRNEPQERDMKKLIADQYSAIDITNADAPRNVVSTRIVMHELREQRTAPNGMHQLNSWRLIVSKRIAWRHDAKHGPSHQLPQAVY